MSKELIIPPTEDIRKKYTAEVMTPLEPGTWLRPEITVFRNHPDGTKEPVYTYQRNYRHSREFEPFRQYRDGEWKEYALLSSNYTNFEVLDLETRTIIAVEEVYKVDEKRHETWKKRGFLSWIEKHPIGSELPAQFCPVEFFVPTSYDMMDRTPEEFQEILDKDDELSDYNRKIFPNATGEYALYSGCQWGDDWSWKLRYIDLSRISEGIVTADERFGYYPLVDGNNLRDSVEFLSSARFSVPLAMFTDPVTGTSYEHGVNWAEED